MKNRFRDEIMSELASEFSTEQLSTIDSALVRTLEKYNLELATHEIVVYSPFPECVKIYLATKKIQGLSEKTLYQYAIRLRQFFSMVRKPMTEITANDVRLFLYNIQAASKMSNRTLDCVRTVISTFFRWACVEGYMPYDICANIVPIKYQKKEREPLTPTELELVRAACKTLREKALVELLYSTGCRVSEVANMKIADIRFDKDTITVLGKGSKYRVVPLNPRSHIALQAYLNSRTDGREYVFVGTRSPHDGLKKNAIEDIIRDIGVRSGIGRKLYPHLIRHTTASIALSRGMKVTEIQTMLGHANIGTTMIYAKQDTSSMLASHSKCVV